MDASEDPKICQLFLTARKRGLGQGNIFIGVCQEFCSREAGGGGVVRGVSASGRGLVLGRVSALEGSAPRGLVCGPGGWSRGVPGGDPPERLLLQAVSILLECILVII